MGTLPSHGGELILSPSSEKIDEIRVPDDFGGQRLDIFIHKKHPELSRSQIKRLIEKGFIQLNGGACKSSRLLKGGEQVFLRIPKPEPLELIPEAIPLDILYEDEDCLVLNKPAERVVHPGAGIRKGTLVHAILHHCQDLSGIGGKLRPGIVHRLDKGTSGVLVIAKNDAAHGGLSEQFKTREVKKVYLAMVWGTPEPRRGKITFPLGRDRRDRKKISPRTEKSREALTEYEVLKSFGKLSWVRLKPLTGRTHQIRVHLAELGHPVVGDPLYGKGIRQLASLPHDLREKIQAYPYQLLHASHLEFNHPRTGKRIVVEAPLREEMADLLKYLEENQ